MVLLAMVVRPQTRKNREEKKHRERERVLALAKRERRSFGAKKRKEQESKREEGVLKPRSNPFWAFFLTY